MIKKVLGSLIILFGLINISFGDYSVHPINGYASSTGDPSFEISVLTKGNLSTINGTISKNVFSPLNGLIFYRNQNQNPILILPDSGVGERWGGELKYYYTCDKIPDSNFNGMENCGNAQVVDKDYLNSFLSSISNSDRWAYQLINGFNQQYKFQICFSSSELDKSLCFGVASRAYNLRINLYQFTLENNINPFSGSYINVYNYNFDNIPNIFIGNSPGTNITSNYEIPDYEFNEDDSFTNRQIIEGYNAMGLTDEFCYGGFDIDNIFQNGTVPQQFTGYRWGGGAFIFDIWDIYSGAYNNDYVSFLRSYYISYENENYSDFYGTPKALYGFINQWFSVSSKGLGFIESTAPTFTLVDVWQYCDLRFNKNPNAIYTGNRWDPKYRYYTSGMVNLGGYFNFSGNNNYFSGNLSGFNTPKDFFASLNSIFQGGLNNLENREPVLPTYIIVFFLAIIFIRIISH